PLFRSPYVAGLHPQLPSPLAGEGSGERGKTQPTIPHHSSMKTKKADHPTGLFPLCPRAETQRSRCCSLSGTPSHSSASGNGSFFSVMFGQISASSAFSSVKCC